MNPLIKHFRQPGASVELPSNGNFQEPGNVEFSPNNTVPILAITARDELLLKNPDYIISGQAVYEMIKSCCPSIKDPWQLPVQDVDVLILAIRQSSYGNNFELEVECPECEAVLETTLDIEYVLSTATKIDTDLTMRVDDDTLINLKPASYRDMATILDKSFKLTSETRHLLSDENLSDEAKRSILNKNYNDVYQIKIETIASMIESIVIPECVVTERDYIIEYLSNISVKLLDELEERVSEIRKFGVDTTIEVKCGACEHEFKTTYEADPASFFG